MVVPAVGQVWASNDPRRLSAFRIIEVSGTQGCKDDPGFIIGEPVYPKTGRLRCVALEAFHVTGQKGYRRIA